MADLSYDEISKILKYDAETGKMFWLPRPVEMFKVNANRKDTQIQGTWNTKHAGKEALTFVDNKGYRRGHILGRLYRAHRVAWILHVGSWPVDQIDHINGDPADNRFENLREADGFKNAKNRSRHRNNTSGACGISWSKTQSKWRARIHVDGKSKHLGYFTELVEAVSSQENAYAEFGFHENHGRL